MDLEALYARLPIALQNVAASLEGWRVQRARYGSGFHRTLEGYGERAGWSPDRLREHRDTRLRRFVAHAAGSVPHYRDLFRELGAEAGDFRTLADLDRLPLLEKSTVQDDTERFVSEAVDRSETTTSHTSGSTGAGLVFPVTREAVWEQWAVWWRFRRAHGLDLTTPCLVLGGRSVVPLTQRRPPYWRSNRPGRQLLFSGYHLGRETAGQYLDAMERSGYRWMHGYPSLIALLAGYALELGRRLPLGWISLGAEGVFEQQRLLIEQAFGVEPITHYGMAEGVANISQSAKGRFVVDEDYAAVEFVAREDGRHDIVGTNFTNDAFPLIRYQVGDVATLPAGGAAGRERTVVHVDGRREDYVVTRDGARIGRLDHIFKDMVNVREAQIRQSVPGQMSLRVVRGPRYGDADEKLLAAETRKRVGDEVRFEILYCDTLPRTRSGKLRFVVSELKQGQLDPSGRTSPLADETT